MHRLAPALKIIGILLFAGILLRLDRAAVQSVLANADWQLLLLSFLQLHAVYAVKALRLHIMIRSAGLPYTWEDSWKLTMKGFFFAIITPAKIGELGRAMYLRRDGLPTATAIGIVLLDRIADACVIAVIAVGALGILFGANWSALGLFMLLAGAAAALYLREKKWFSAIHKILRYTLAYRVLAVTAASWCVYFLWTVTIARALGIDLPVILLIAVFTVAGIIALLPIAPSGLGTRDAALIALLGPYGVAQERAVALAFLMFLSIVLSSVLGGFYWIGERKQAHRGQFH